MPSISVPLQGEKGWPELMHTRREWWGKEGRNKLTTNFKATEFYCNDGSPCPIVSRPAMVRLAKDYLEPLRKKFGTCFILSGYRHKVYNAKIGGVPNSQHEYEQTYDQVATDVRFAKGSPSLWAAEAKKIRATHGGKGGIGLYIHQGFVHIDNRNYKADWKE